MNTERSFAAPRTFPDAYIEHWGCVYLEPRNNLLLRARVAMFETFLLAPERHLRRIERPRRVTVSSCGLLPAQRDVQRRLDLQEAFIEMVDCAVRAIRGESHCADGRWTEKLKHRTWPRHRGRRTTKEAT